MNVFKEILEINFFFSQVINTPHNPLGKIFSREELEFIGNLCKKHNTIALMDEVYEHIVYDGLKHIRMNTLPDMWEVSIFY